MRKFLEGADSKRSEHVSGMEGGSAAGLLEFVMGNPNCTLDDARWRMHGNMRSSPGQIFAALEGYVTPTQRKFFTRAMNIIREQTGRIKASETPINSVLCENYKSAMRALDKIPGTGPACALAIAAETGTDMRRFRNQHAFPKWAGAAPGNNESAGKA